MSETNCKELPATSFTPDKLSLPKNLLTWLELLNTQISKKRALINSDTEVLKHIMQLAMNLNILGVRTPKHYNGLGLDLKGQHYYNKAMAKASGTLAFFLTQFSGALSLIASGDNLALKDKWLNKDQLRNTSFGVSFAHLRNTISPPVTAEEKETHYIVNGTLRYVSGYNIFNMLVLGFACGNEEIFAILPFCESKSFIVLPGLSLVAANSTNTVSCQLVNQLIDKNMIISKQPLGTFSKNVTRNPRHIVIFEIGLGLAALDLINASSYLEIDIVNRTYNDLLQRISACDAEMLALPETVSVLPLRIKVINILSQIFLFGDQIFKGSATISNNPFLVIKQEAQILSAAASTEETLIETCNLLID